MEAPKRETQAWGMLLLSLIPMALLVVSLWPPRSSGGMGGFEVDTVLTDSLNRAWTARHTWKKDSTRRRPVRFAPHAEDTVPLVMQPFDPNTVDSATLRQLGMKPWQARAFVHYREAGARFGKNEDIKRLRWLNDSMYAALEPWMVIEGKDSVVQPMRVVKKDTVLDLNTADTLLLQYIPGIGRGYARRIVNYRRSLGGYVHLRQLSDKEVDIEHWEDFAPYFLIDTTCVKKLVLEGATAARLARHPYITFTQAKALETEQRRRGIRSRAQIERLGVFTEEELERLWPYLQWRYE